ncbi:MAG: radical SAM protein [Pseudonocardiaceae bacterium]
MSTTSVLVVSSFEAELQPLAAACAAAAVRDAGAEVRAWDAHLAPDAAPAGDDGVVLLSVQQFEGLQRGLDLVPQLRPRARNLVAFGQYAQLNARAFLEAGVDGVLLDEPERCAKELATTAVDGQALSTCPGMLTGSSVTPKGPRQRLSWSVPARDLFPDLVHYPAHHTTLGLMGNLELSRGCHHRCTYCSVFGAYDGGIVPIEIEPVVADAIALADEGIRHFCFIDAEFFNSRRLGLQAIERITDAVGPCTIEFTTRVDHILDYVPELERLRDLGLARITTAMEFPSDRMLRIFDKGIGLADLENCIATAHQLGITLNPTFIPFSPWVDYDELLGFEDWLVRTGLAATTHPTSLQTRLLLFKGSPLLRSPWISDIPLTDAGFHFEWLHEDYRVEQLWQQRRSDAEGAGAVRCCVKC